MQSKIVLFLCAVAFGACSKKTEGGSSGQTAAPAASAVLAYADLTAKMTEKKDAWIGKEVTVKGPFAVQRLAGEGEPNGGVALGTSDIGADKSDHVNCIFAAATPAADQLQKGAQLTVHGKVTALDFGEPEIRDCKIVDGVK